MLFITRHCLVGVAQRHSMGSNNGLLEKLETDTKASPSSSQFKTSSKMQRENPMKGYGIATIIMMAGEKIVLNPNQ